MSQKENFLLNRWKSMGYALRGCFLLIKTENAMQVHLAMLFLFIILGFWLEISRFEWIIQLLIFGTILAIESLNTAIEKLCDFVHKDFHHKIGFIKDISAGAVTFIVIFSYISLVIIYFQKIYF